MEGPRSGYQTSHSTTHWTGGGVAGMCGYMRVVRTREGRVGTRADGKTYMRDCRKKMYMYEWLGRDERTRNGGLGELWDRRESVCVAKRERKESRGFCTEMR